MIERVVAWLARGWVADRPARAEGQADRAGQREQRDPAARQPGDHALDHGAPGAGTTTRIGLMIANGVTPGRCFSSW